MKLYLCDPDKNAAYPARKDETRGCGIVCRHTLNPAWAIAGSVPKEIASGIVIGVTEPEQEKTKCKK